MMTSAHNQAPHARGGLPIVGHAWKLLRDPRRFVIEQTPVGTVVQFRIGNETAFFVTDQEVTAELLVKHNNQCTKGVLFEKFRLIGGNGLITSEGDFHRRQRRLMQPMFSRQHIDHYVDPVREVTAETVGSWRPGEVIDLYKQVSKLGVMSVARALFSKNLGEETESMMVRCVPVVVEGVVKRSWVPLEWPFELPTPGNRRFARYLTTIQESIARFIADYRSDEVHREDLLSRLLEARDPETGEAMDDQQVLAEVLTMFGAGAETTAAALAWLFHVLGQRPDIEARLRREVDDVVGDQGVTASNLSRLEYLRWCVAETLRLYSGGWFIPRRAQTDLVLGGYHIPAGANVFFSSYGLHHDRRNFENPERFDPDRWSPERAGRVPQHAYIPFGLGIRQCIGNHFASTVLGVAVATILGHWRLRPQPGYRVRTVVRTTIHPKALPMIVEPR